MCIYLYIIFVCLFVCLFFLKEPPPGFGLDKRTVSPGPKGGGGGGGGEQPQGGATGGGGRREGQGGGGGGGLTGGGTRNKFVPLMGREDHGRSVHIPGRHPCQCLAQKHELVNNCLECGRVVCSQVHRYMYMYKYKYVHVLALFYSCLRVCSKPA